MFHRSNCRRRAAALTVVLAMSASAAAQTMAQMTVTAAKAQDVSMEQYRAHLTALIPVVDGCAKARDLKSCDAARVGPDDRVPLNGGRRLIRYAWLRVLLAQALVKDDKPAAKPDEKPTIKLDTKPGDKPESPAADRPLTTAELLENAVDRLDGDLEQAGGPSAPVKAHPAVRGAMEKVLSGHEFANLNKRSLRDSMLEDIGNWLNRLLAKAAGHRIHSPWVGRLLVGGFILLVCIGLAWGLLQMERKWRIRLVPENDVPAAGAASARDWQLWLEDARKAAQGGAWRDAIHSVYWAVISRLESRRTWPADRARTPREYLALVQADDARKAGLTRLTGSFERTWYGGRAAVESDYRSAELLAEELIRAGQDRGKGGAA